MHKRYLVSSHNKNNYTFKTMSGVKTFLKTLSGQEVEDEIRLFVITYDNIKQLDFEIKYNNEFEIEVKD